jgi:hypothetical protein
MDRKREVGVVEDHAWGELWALLESIDPGRLEQPGYFEDWSAKDLMAHIGCWQAETVQVLEQIRCGTYVRFRVDVDGFNARFREATRDLPVRVVWAELCSARTRMPQEWSALPDVTPEAEEWFVESGPAHYAEHMVRLREWVGELG